MELCSVCSQLVASDPVVGDQILGPYDELLLKSQSLGPGRAGCGGCEFFSTILQSSKTWSDRIPELSDHTITLSPDGLLVRALSGPIDLLREEVDYDLELTTCFAEEKRGRCVVMRLGAIRLLIRDHLDHQFNNTFLGMTLVSPNPRESSCFNLIDDWINQCTEHVKCSPLNPVALPKRVIEIPIDPLAPPRLRITNGALGRYVILSHCWGVKGLMTLTNSLLPQYQEAISLELLPNSFTDAIEISRRLGFRYIWIDALCIIQDNAEDWDQEAGKMASYYGLSTLMISATAAEDSSRGILNRRDVSRSPMLGKGKSFYLHQIMLRHSFQLNSSILSTRGWAAQERMLAPRILHYTRQQMIWECAECLFYEAFSSAGAIKTWHDVYSKSACQQFVTEALSQESTIPRYQDHNAKMLECGSKGISLDRIETWHQCVGMYSSRFLSVPTDKLHAIAGVARMLNHSGQLGEYLAGIWSTHLAVGLAWKKESRNLALPPFYIAPSWSWAGVEGGVDYKGVWSSTAIVDTNESWAKTFHPKLIDQHMILQNEHNIYGAVLEGSHIIVEGACLRYADFDQFFEAYEVGDHYVGQITLDMEDGQDFLGTCDFCMCLEGNLDCDESMDLLLLSWVDQEARVAPRVGIATILPPWQEEDAEQFTRTFKTASWERRTLKLV